MARRPRGSLGVSGLTREFVPACLAEGVSRVRLRPARTRVRSAGAVASRGEGQRARAAGSGAGRTCQPIGSIQRMRGIAVEREGRGMIAQDDGGELEAPPRVDPRQAQRRCHRRPGVARAPESGTGTGGGSLEGGGPPWLLGRRPRGDQSIEIGGPGPRGVRPRRDVVRAAGPRGGRGEPADARDHEDRDEPSRRRGGAGHAASRGPFPWIAPGTFVSSHSGRTSIGVR